MLEKRDSTACRVREAVWPACRVYVVRTVTECDLLPVRQLISTCELSVLIMRYSHNPFAELPTRVQLNHLILPTTQQQRDTLERIQRRAIYASAVGFPSLHQFTTVPSSIMQSSPSLAYDSLLKGHSGFIFDAEFSMPRRR